MYSKIYPLLLGYNNNKLFGTKNDLYIIYNLFYSFFNIFPSNWFVPKMFYNEDLKLINILNYIKTLNLIENILLIIYFSGESNKKGRLKFYNQKINIHTFLYNINKTINTKINIFFIVDSCYSKQFIHNFKNKYDKINIIYILGSCNENEQSKEVSNTYDPLLFDIMDIEHTEHIVSIFTLYFCKLIKIKKYQVEDFKKLEKDPIFKMIASKFKQTIFYNEFFYI